MIIVLMTSHSTSIKLISHHPRWIKDRAGKSALCSWGQFFILSPLPVDDFSILSRIFSFFQGHKEFLLFFPFGGQRVRGLEPWLTSNYFLSPRWLFSYFFFFTETRISVTIFEGKKSALVCQSKLFDDVNAYLYQPGLLSFSVPCLITMKLWNQKGWSTQFALSFPHAVCKPLWNFINIFRTNNSIYFP